ncbi:MAG: carbohydrate kinase family protein [Clostridiales bacterium]|jgi:sugar/nucleoside kinase (ribokinase family)|nr:carbohydrate kinase family protein [Clostridiales bacterium]
MFEGKYDVVCLSDCCCDIIFSGMARIPSLGAEEYAKTLTVTSGGGANTAVGLARLGARVGYVTAIGEDFFGGVLAGKFREYGVSGEFVQKSDSAATWLSAVMSSGTDRAFASFAGTPVRFDAEIAAQVLPRTRHLHTYAYYGLKFKALTALCQEYGVSYSLDSSFDPGLTLKDLEPLLKPASFFTPNADEALSLTGETDVKKALGVLKNCCGYVIITMGKDGCLAAKDGNIFRVDAAPVSQVTDTNGAGDLFAAGLLYSHLKGEPVDVQLKTASASGSLGVTFAGGMDDSYNLAAVKTLAEKI